MSQKNEYTEGELVRVKPTWWDRKVVNKVWIVGDPDWFGKVYLIHLDSRDRYFRNIQFNDWANDWKIKKTQVPDKYLEKVDWDILKTRKGGAKMPRILKFFFWLGVVVLLWKIIDNLPLTQIFNKLLGF